MGILGQTWQFIVQHPGQFWQATYQQIYLVMIPMAAAILFAVPVTILSTRVQWLYRWVMGFSNAMQTIPSLALLVIMIAIGLGIGAFPAIAALFLYALMPIVRNTYVGIASVPAGVKDAALGMGVTQWQMLRIIELPLALRIIIAGARSALVASIGFATLAALIGGGGLGGLILQGLGEADNSILLAGTIPAVIMAFVAEWLMGRLETALTPRGVR